MKYECPGRFHKFTADPFGNFYCWICNYPVMRIFDEQPELYDGMLREVVERCGPLLLFMDITADYLDGGITNRELAYQLYCDRWINGTEYHMLKNEVIGE